MQTNVITQSTFNKLVKLDKPLTCAAIKYAKNEFGGKYAPHACTLIVLDEKLRRTDDIRRFATDSTDAAKRKAKQMGFIVVDWEYPNGH